MNTIKNFILSFSGICGRIAGSLMRLCLLNKFSYPIYIFKRNFTTALYRKDFAAFGRGSLLSPDLQITRPKQIFIGTNVSILRHCVLEVCSHNGKIELDDHVSLGEYAHITSACRVKIGRGVLTGRFVLITDNSHGSNIRKELDVLPLSRPVVSKGEVIIGNNVWLGDKVTVLPGVHIGDGAVIGANSVVTKDIPAYSVAVGIPCKVMKDLKK